MPKRSRKNRIFYLSAVLTFRSIFHKVALILILALAASILVIGKSKQEEMVQLRAIIVDASVPLLKVVSAPVDAVLWMRNVIHDSVFVYHENKMLRQQNARLTRVQIIASQLQAENVRLRQMLNFIPEANYRFITARVVNDLSSPFSQTTIINAGSDNGVKKGQVVLNERGLVGRVMEVSDDNARVLLLSDVNSRVPVVTSNSHERGILVGGEVQDGSVIRHLPIDTEIQPGESVVTSGDGQYFPAGLPVGIVKEIKDEGAQVTLFVHRKNLEFVNVVDYNPVVQTPVPETKTETPAAGAKK